MEQVTTPGNETRGAIFFLLYIKQLKSFLWIIGGWPGETFGEHVPLLIKLHRKFVPMVHGMAFIGQCNYIRKFSHSMDLFLKGNCYITTILSILTIARTALPSFAGYGIVTKDFFFTFHLINYKHKGAYYEKIHETVEKASNLISKVLVPLGLVAVLLFNVPVWYQNYKKGVYFFNVNNATLEFSVYYTYPGFYIGDHYSLCSFINVYLTYNCSASVIGLDLMLAHMMFQIIGHTFILMHNLGSLPSPKERATVTFHDRQGVLHSISSEKYDVEENAIIYKRLTECVDHHRLIIRFTRDVSTFYGPMLAVNYLFHLVSLCLLLLECAKGDISVLMQYGPLTVIVFGQLFLVSVTFEITGAVSERLPDTVYAVPWEYMDTRNRRLVGFLLKRSQTPVRVVVMGLATVGVNTMIGILKTTFTYFTFLKSMG